MCITLDMSNTVWEIVTYFIINDGGMIIEVQLKNIVLNHIT